MSPEVRAASQNPHETQAALARLEADGFLLASRTTRRWQQAMARAAVKLYASGDPGDDLRVPIALALVDVYADRIDDELLAQLVEAMLPLELATLGLAPAPPSP
jgi:hypothetical protein